MKLCPYSIRKGQEQKKLCKNKQWNEIILVAYIILSKFSVNYYTTVGLLHRIFIQVLHILAKNL